MTDKIRFLNLSKREKLVIEYLVQGFTNGEIGRKLGCSESCIKIHVSNILSKMDVRNRAQLGFVIGKDYTSKN